MIKHLIDDTIISQFSKGDQKCFALIYQKYQQPIYNNIGKLIFQEDAVNDILQEVFYKLWENRHRFTDDQSVASWLFTVSYNQSISYIRKIIKDKASLSDFVLNDSEITPEDYESIEDLKLDLLTDAINQLPNRRKQVFELCKLQGKTYSEAAAILGIAPDTVKEHMSAALKFVKSYVLAHYSPDSAVSAILISFYLQ